MKKINIIQKIILLCQNIYSQFIYTESEGYNGGDDRCLKPIQTNKME